MGTVFLARHEALDRTAAVKVMLAIGDDPIAAGRFQREGRALALLRHPNVVTVYDFGEYEGTPYMIEEHIAGGSLAERMKEGRPKVADAIRLLRGMAAGLDYAHQRGVVHRDVKPANVLMAPDDTPVLADFGLAKVEQQATMTASGVATGTPAYMAPEQITDEGEIGPATDIYALATVAYEMLTGRFPYESDNVMQLLMSKVRDEPIPPTEREPDLPRRVDSVLLRGLAREPSARWKSCSMMVEALAAVLEPKTDLFATTQPIQGGRAPGWWAERMRGWKDWAWLGLPVAAILALALVFVVIPRLTQHSALGPAGGPVLSPCPEVSPSPPQLSASPNPATAGQPVSIAASGFETGDPLFVVIDSVGDCSNPTAGVKVFNSSSYSEPVQTEPSPLPDAVTAGTYQLRACNQRPGEAPSNCVQVPFSMGAVPSPGAASPERG
jgi:serine/threonine-protein kinase